MKITFLLPCYMWVPSGGFRVVYEYANQLVARGHEVRVIHPRHLKDAPVASPQSLRGRLRKAVHNLREFVSEPRIDWHTMDPRVDLRFVPDSEVRHIPDGDVLFATAWDTVASVLCCPPEKGRKAYLIQHYETWMGPKRLVDETWRAPLHKVVVSRWLADVGASLGVHDLTHISNGIDHSTYRVLRPIEGRPKQIVMMCSLVDLKRCQDGIRAIEIAKRKFPELKAVLFGNGRRPPYVPWWMPFWRNPPQRQIVEQFYNNSKIVLNSSLTEGFALPPAEGAACGCAIVATDSGGIRDFVEHGRTGLLSPPADPEALAKNLCLLLSNDALCIRLAKAGHDSIARLRWSDSTSRLEEFLQRVMRQDTTMDSNSSPFNSRAPMIRPEGRVA